MLRPQEGAPNQDDGLERIELKVSLLDIERLISNPAFHNILYEDWLVFDDLVKCQRAL